MSDSTELSYIGKQAFDAYHACLYSNHIAAKNNKAVIYRLLGEYDNADEYFNAAVSEALKHFYGFTGIKMNLGVVKSDKKKTAEAMENYTYAMEDLSGEEDSSIIAPRIYYNQAWEHYQSGDFSESRTKTLATIGHQKTNDFLKAKAYVLLGINDAALEDTLTSIDNFQNAIDIDSTSCIANIAQENIWILNTNTYERITICQGENYQGWEETGQYTRKLESVIGMDSIVTTKLTVIPTDIIIDTTICEGESYNGWTTSGQYTENLVSLHGCDSIVSTNLVVGSPYNPTKDITICEGEGYNGWTTSGQYVENLISSHGCDSIVTTNLVVNPSYIISIDVSILEGESYNGWTTSGQYVQNLLSLQGCDSVVTVNLTIITGIEHIETNMFTLYPNPNSGSFTLLFNDNITGIIKIKVLNALGKQVYIEELKGRTKKHDIQLDNINKGTYIIYVQTGENKISKKIIVQ